MIDMMIELMIDMNYFSNEHESDDFDSDDFDFDDFDSDDSIPMISMIRHE
jgi:hypothetical protein